MVNDINRAARAGCAPKPWRPPTPGMLMHMQGRAAHNASASRATPTGGGGPRVVSQSGRPQAPAESRSASREAHSSSIAGLSGSQDIATISSCCRKPTRLAQNGPAMRPGGRASRPWAGSHGPRAGERRAV